MIYAPIIYALAVNVVCIVILSYKFMLVLHYMGEKLTISYSIAIVSLGQVLSYITPLNLGVLAVRSVSGKILANVEPKKMVFATLFDQWLELLAQVVILALLMVSVGFKALKFGFGYSAVLFVLAIIMMAFIFYKPERSINFILKFKSLIPGFLRKILRRKINSKDIVGFSEQFESYKLLERKKILVLLSVYIIFVLVYPLIFYLLLDIFSISLSYINSFIFVWLSYILGRISGIPGGLGARDVSLAGLITAQGIGIGSVVMIIFLYRIVTMLPSFIIGIPLLFYCKNEK